MCTKGDRVQSEGRKSELWGQEWAFTLFAVLWYIPKMSTIKKKKRENVGDIAVGHRIGRFPSSGHTTFSNDL